MKHLTAFIFLILLTLTVEAKKINYPFEIIAGTADLIVIGEIEAVQNNSYVFKITETLKGKLYKSITVEKFKEWICDSRFDKYENKQRLCLFLKKGLLKWEIINGSNGERLISNDSITIGGNEEYIHVDYKFKPYKLSINEFKTGVIEFRKNYKFIGKYAPHSLNGTFKQLGSDNEILSFKQINKFTNWLYNKVIKYTIIKKQNNHRG